MGILSFCRPVNPCALEACINFLSSKLHKSSLKFGQIACFVPNVTKLQESHTLWETFGANGSVIPERNLGKPSLSANVSSIRVDTAPKVLTGRIPWHFRNIWGAKAARFGQDLSKRVFNISLSAQLGLTILVLHIPVFGITGLVLVLWKCNRVFNIDDDHAVKCNEYLFGCFYLLFS
ncbi:hypothetical protein Tco_0829038 [Tanacetum coccineum]